MFDEILKRVEKEYNGIKFIFEKHSILGQVCIVKDMQLDINDLDFDNDLDDFCRLTANIFKKYNLTPSYMPKMNKDIIDKLSDFDSLIKLLDKYRG